MTTRLDIQKTYKLFIGGAFPRSESGRSEVITALAGAEAGHVLGHSSKASRKDLRDAVVAARAGLGKWKSATAYNRAQVLYRLAEMLQARRPEFIEVMLAGGEADAHRTIDAAVDRIVYFAGWADKWSQMLGVQNPVAGPYWNISTPEPVGVVGIVTPGTPSLLPLVSLVAPALATGCAVVVVSPAFAPVVSTFGEVAATSDLPAGALNLLTGDAAELVPFLAKHRDVDAIVTAGLADDLHTTLRQGASENLKRVTIHPMPAATTHQNPWLDSAWQSLAMLEPMAEIKTVWHPVGT
jgi:acyl-CoA reductase-like NAD-dependent aldehyde dehydrogenase